MGLPDPVLRLLLYKAAAEADAGVKGKELAPIAAMDKLLATDITRK